MLEQFLLAFLLTVFLSIALNVILKKFEIPTIIGYIITGTIISEFFYLKSNDYLIHIAEFGIVFLMFTIGLEFSFKHLMTMKKDVFVNGNLQVFISGVVLTFFIYYTIDLAQNSAIIVGLALALSSTAIVLKILNDSGDITQRYGRKSLGILIFQDIAVIPILIMIDMFSSSQTSLDEMLAKTFFGAFILIAILYVIGKYFINWIFYKVIHTNSQEIFIATVFFTVIGSSALSYGLGFSFSLGAFLAGMMIAETEFKHKIEADLIPFRDILLGIFFISIGMQISIPVILSNIIIILYITIGAMTIKALIIFAILMISQSIRVSFKTAVTLSQVGEFALAVFGLMATRELLDANTAQILIASSVLSMFLTPFILKNLNFIADKIEKEVIIEPEQTIKQQTLKDHIVVFGYGNLGQEVVLQIKQRNLPYIVIENALNLVELGRSRGENVFLGNAIQETTFEYACVKSAAAVIVAVSNEQKLELITKTISNYDENIQTVIVISEQERFEEIFNDLGDNFCFVKQEKALGEILVRRALQCNL
ncbi:MAG: cation:proton antiporter domain-containing protein [Campylobacter sp.]